MDLRGADMARRGHVTAAREATRTHAGPCGGLRGAKESGYVYWAHRYSGPMRLIGGRNMAHWATQTYKGVCPYICKIFTYFLLCGTKCLFMFSGGMAAWTVGFHRANRRASILWTSFHQITIKRMCIIQSCRSLK